MQRPALAIVAALLAWSAPAAAEEPKPKPAKEAVREAPAPEGFLEMFVAAVIPTEGGPAVVLRDKAEKTLLPIWVGAVEAHAIQLRLERRRFPRPLTHDLLDAIVHDLGGEILKVHVDDLRGEAFVGTVFVKLPDRVTRYDARASDSIALAVGNGAPIYVSKAVLDRVHARREDLEQEPAAKHEEDEPTRTPAKPPAGIQTL